MSEKKLFRSSANKKLCGVCGGLAEYLGMDATVMRILWVLFALLGGCGILAYLICALIMPVKE
ncbi:MAG: PspC domain-containing protein [Bacteroidaceae bacterium]|nr:PspC domain-containing protein [Bacteroidaceae bacterium]